MRSVDAFATALNDLLVSTFHSILKLEEESLRRMGPYRLSISEMHLLEAVARGGDCGRSVSDIARELGITLPSVTAAVNKLEGKGFVTRTRSDADKRSVIVMLAPDGRRAEASHRFFHRHMVSRVSDSLSTAERDALLKGLNNLRAFFDQRERALEGMDESAGSPARAEVRD
ncbi:MAG TPA: MarR family transcriptional regulator [Candidatus Limnocylindria bacterium]|nr:MarR family transcriptional regulator [Candidatus Limnocylindria bacterium]